MSFFNDECDLVDDDQFDLFTLSTQVERRRKHTNPRAETATAEPTRGNGPVHLSVKQLIEGEEAKASSILLVSPSGS